MSFTITSELHPFYIKISVTGVQTVEAVSELVRFVRTSAETHKSTRILVDYRGVSLSDLSTRQRLALGDKMAGAIGSSLKVAVVFDAPRINRAAEFTAAREGARITTVTSEAEGIAWLRQ